MEVIGPSLAVVVLGILLWRKERQLESVMEANEKARAEQAATAAREREELIAHVQAPEVAVHDALTREVEPVEQPVPDMGPFTEAPEGWDPDENSGVE